ncbi:MAG TPA: ABC transporter permease [Vicinamibacterales bacterium]|nr:ABC transporter permease [Vicinamibacterales bacterium]
MPQEELGDVIEEYTAGKRTRLWLLRQMLSAIPRSRSRFAIDQKGSRQMLSSLTQDLRYVLRTLRRSPGFAVAAIAPIALGIGINTGVFSILNNVMYRPLPAPEPDQLLSIYQDFRGVQKRSVHGARSMFSLPEYRAYRDGAQTLSGATAYTKSWTVTLGGQSPQEIEGVLVACNYFDVLRLRPAIGTGFTADCDVANAPPAVVLSHALWTRAFAADPAIVHKTITLNGLEVAVVGVAPEGFDGTELTRAAFFAPVSLQPAFYPERNFLDDPQVSWLTLLARRREDTAIDQVRTELAVLASRLDLQQPGRATTLLVAPATSLSLPVARRDLASVAVIVVSAFGLILLIACANVANVLLARGEARSREIAVRLAIGARRARLVQLMLTESVVIALIGGVAGSLLAWWSFQALVPSMLSSVPRISQPRLDAHPNLTVLWFGLAITMATALVCGVVPALRGSKQEPYGIMKQDGAQLKGHPGWWLRGALISIQVAVCMVLLISAGLLLRALHAAYALDPGFQYRNVAVVSVDLRGPRYSDSAVEMFRRQVIEQLGSLPGVTAVAQVSRVPLSPGRSQGTFRLPDMEHTYEFDVNTVSPEYFTVLGIPIVSGRTFTRAELDRGARAVIVTEATARRFWPGQDPVGRTIVAASSPEAVLEIVGIAGDAHVSHIANTESSYFYLPAGPSVQRRLALLVRSETGFEPLARSIRSTIEMLDEGLLAQVQPLGTNLDFWRRGSRSVATLAGSLSVLALAIACIGVYGVVSYVVMRRRREVGIRMMLGASTRAVQALILRETLRPVGLGVLVGVAAAGASSHALRSTLFGISPFDPIAFVAAAIFLLIVAAVATVLPTREALRADPVTALRHD